MKKIRMNKKAQDAPGHGINLALAVIVFLVILAGVVVLIVRNSNLAGKQGCSSFVADCVNQKTGFGTAQMTQTALETECCGTAPKDKPYLKSAKCSITQTECEQYVKDSMISLYEKSDK